MSGTIFFASAGMGARCRDQRSGRQGWILGALRSRPRHAASSRGREHKLAGESYVGRVLVLDAAKGGVATAWMLHEMKARGVMPAALVLNAVNPIMVQGAALADFTMISGFDLRHHAGDPERRVGGSRSDRRAAIHTHCLKCGLRPSTQLIAAIICPPPMRQRQRGACSLLLRAG